MRRIIHVDLDAFYASVEELDHPEWVGHPLVVGADPQQGRGRGVVTTANYAARAFGIRSAMPISEAWRRCPTARYVYPRFERYHEMSEQVFAVFREMADVVEGASIDEAYIDATARTTDFDEAVTLAREMQTAVRDRTGLSASFGVASNKLVAKIASDMQKPGGVTPVTPGTEAAFLAPLPARKIPGVGPKTEERLVDMGVKTCGDLAALPPAALADAFGVWGPRLAQLAGGIDDTPVSSEWARKSLGSETTFARDSANATEWARTVAELARSVTSHLRDERLLARTVTLKLRVTGFETITRARSLTSATDDPEAIAHAAGALLRENMPDKPVRLLGVRLSHLETRGGARQRDLRDWPADLLGEADAWVAPQRRLDAPW